MAAGRKPTPTAEAVPAAVNSGALQVASNALTVLSEEAIALQKTFGLDSLDPNVLEREIGIWIEHTGKAMFMVGARLLALRTVCPRGDWTPRLQRLGVAPRSAQKFMSAALRCVGPDGEVRDSMLQLSRSKVLELVTLDDSKLDELEKTGAIAQLQLELDDIDRMSVSELRERLRETEATVASKQKLIDKKDQKLNELAEKLERPFKPSADSEARNAEEQALLDESRDRVVEVEMALRQLAAVMERGGESGIADAVHKCLHDDMAYLAQRVAEIIQAAGVDVNFEEQITPRWIKQAMAKRKAK